MSYVQGVLRPFGHYLHWDTALRQGGICRLPDTFENWQRLVLQFGLWYISRPGTKASLETLCRDGQKKVRPWLEFLQEDGLIPLGVMLPDFRLPEEQGSHGSPHNPRLLGEQPAKPTRDDEPVEKVRKPLDKTLAGPIFWHTDTEYLDQVETSLRHRDQILADALNDYWLRLVRDYRRGQQMLQLITADDWTGDSVLTTAFKLSELVRYCAHGRASRQPCGFGDLTDNDIGRLIEKLCTDVYMDDPSQRLRNNNTVRAIMQTILSFLVWYQNNLYLKPGRLIGSSGEGAAIVVTRKNNPHNNRYYWHHRYLPPSVSTDPKLPMGTTMIEDI